MSNEYYGAATTPMDDYLAHYGVLGMKWGIRRAAKKGTNYQYKSHATKKYEKVAAKLKKKAAQKSGEKSAKLNAKAAKMQNRAKRSSEVDRGEEEYARGLSTRNAVGLALLGGTDRMKAYAQHRAMSGQKGKDATGHKVAAGVQASYSGTMGSRMRKYNYIRQGEKSNSINRKLHNFNNRIRNEAAAAIDPAASAYNREKKRKKKSSRA